MRNIQAQEHNHRHSAQADDQYLPGVKPHGCRRIDLLVVVVDRVQTPEEWNVVRGDVERILPEIQQHERDGHRSPPRKRKLAENTEPMLVCHGRSPGSDPAEHSPCNKGVHYAKRQVPYAVPYGPRAEHRQHRFRCPHSSQRGRARN